MKKFLLILSAVLITVGLCSCGDTKPNEAKVPIPEINPIEIITPEDVYAAINYAYAPVLDGDAYTRDANKATAFYRSEPIGQDPVIVEITQYTDSISKENIWYEYDNDRIKRSSAETIPELGEDAFIAFPSIHVFDRGCHIKITAGSGNTEEQRNTLLTLAQTAVSRIEAVMPE